MLAAFRVAEDFVGRLHFLEFLLGGLVARIAVRVILLRLRAVGLLDRRFVGFAIDPENFVEIALAHRGNAERISGTGNFSAISDPAISMC